MNLYVPLRSMSILRSLLVVATCFLVSAANAATYYVAPSGSDSNAGTNWVTAKQTIQAAVNIAVAGDTVMVTNGVYATGTSPFPTMPAGGNSSNRVTITNAILVQSVNGPAVTTIQGAAGSTPATAVRCVYISAGVLSGFTLANGHTPSSVITALDKLGGGAYAVGGTLTNCIVTGSVSETSGGGVYGGTIYNSILSSNTATTGSGGGAARSDLVDCEVFGNQAFSGAGLWEGSARNTTFANNTASSQGGGVRGSTVYNSIFLGNVALNGGGAYDALIYDSTLSTNTATNGGGVSQSTVYNSTISGGYANDNGGGAYFSTLFDTTLSNNIARLFGGGAHNSTLTRCRLIGNSTLGGGDGGGASSSTLLDCLIMSNSVPGAATGGGTFNSTVTRSVYIGNTANSNGGGSSSDTLRNCILTGNTAGNAGGGTFKSQIINSLVAHNTSVGSGGGVSGGSVRHSTVVYNTAGSTGGGISQFDVSVSVFSSIVYSNQAPINANYGTASISYSLTSPLPSGTGNIAGDPLFVDPAAGNYRLAVGSPAIDAALNSHAQTSTDLDDGLRIVNGTMDMGAYEFRASGLSSNVTWYVSTNGYDGALGTSWAAAKRTIQVAVDRAIDGDTIIVNDGVYDTGGAVTPNPGGFVSNRVVVTADILIRSLNGPERTRITGINAGNTANSVRGVFMTSGTMSGFTISGGRAPVITPFSQFETWGGGVYGLGATFEYCIIESNTAHNGGGAYGGTFRNSLFKQNTAANGGGGTSYAHLINCTVSGNHAGSFGGGTHFGTVLNSIVYHNTGGNYHNGTLNYSATTPLPAGTGNITNAPLFESSKDYRLAAGSPGIDAGSNAGAAGVTDLAAGPRIVNGTVDMGAYEFRGTGNDPITWYVATSGNDFAAGTNWSSAKQTIQAAVDKAIEGDTVIVSNGVYATGTAVTPGFATHNRVVITNAITVRSLNGAAVTSIAGLNNGNTLASVRPVYITDGTLIGFTLTGGYAPNVSADSENRNGGGAYAVGGTLDQCIVTGNGGHDGGGVYGGIVNNSIVASNNAVNGGGTHSAQLNNVTVSGNTATTGGGGTELGAANNSIIYFNTSTGSPDNNYLGGSFAYSAATPLPSGTGNINGNPLFVGSNFFLSASSPCVEAGDNSLVVGTGDVEGSGRIVNGVVDMGARELYPFVSVEATGAITTGTGRHIPGTELTISAQRENGHWFFVEWDDGVPNPQPGSALIERVITVPDANITYTAIYTQFLGTLTFHVSTNGNDQLDGFSWATAVRTPQKGADLTLDGDMVLVSDGVYATGGRMVHPSGITNRIAIDKAITVRSLNGPLVTTIVGHGTMGPGAVRGAYVGTNAVLSGFTLRNGGTMDSGSELVNLESGGGAWCEPTGVISNSIIRDNKAGHTGGGVYGGILYNCLIAGNVADAEMSFEIYGGGAHNANLYNCTVVGNRAGGLSIGFGGGTADSTHENTIVYFNTGSFGISNYYGGAFSYSCTAPHPGSGTGNVAGNPLFVSRATTNLALSAGSPAIDAGNTASASGATDVSGQPRIINNLVDMGAYEYQFNGGYWLWAADIDNGLTNLTDSATGDGHPNLLKYITGSSATVPDDLAEMTLVITNGTPVLRFNRNPTATDATIIVETTTNLVHAPWSGLATNRAGSWGASPHVVETGAGSPRTVTVEQTDATNLMYRLRVTRP